MRHPLAHRILQGIRLGLPWLPGGADAMALWPFVLVRRGERTPAWIIHHERIHFLQQLECLYVGFFLVYGIEYLYLRFWRRLGHYRAYRAVRFEQEAYRHQRDPHYLAERKPFAWARRHS